MEELSAQEEFDLLIDMIFDIASKGKDQIDAQSLSQLIRRYKLGAHVLQDTTVEEMITEADLSSSGTVSREEFSELIHAKLDQAPYPMDSVKDAVRGFDPMGSGSFSREEVSTILRRFGDEPMSTREVGDFLEMCDIRGDRVEYGSFFKELDKYGKVV
eukprot:TRINITY_DN10581_c0_g1_i1.p1 TRINITY_DN10581_c0_g1~~TRINITY_DN10581_c0_g1_i1.p1  ORF type:complete len:158 (-),score=30.08 TRINITY_DN10581_c0_g1_i1:72-545(-)